MNCKINKQEAKVKYDGIECCYINIKNINFSQSTVTKEGDQYYLDNENCIFKSYEDSNPLQFIFIRNNEKKEKEEEEKESQEQEEGEEQEKEQKEKIEKIDIYVTGYYGLEEQKNEGIIYKNPYYFPLLEVIEKDESKKYISINNRRLSWIVQALCCIIKKKDNNSNCNLQTKSKNTVLDQFKDLIFKNHSIYVDNIFVPCNIKKGTDKRPKYIMCMYDSSNDDDETYNYFMSVRLKNQKFREGYPTKDLIEDDISQEEYGSDNIPINNKDLKKGEFVPYNDQEDNDLVLDKYRKSTFYVHQSNGQIDYCNWMYTIIKDYFKNIPDSLIKSYIKNSIYNNCTEPNNTNRNIILIPHLDLDWTAWPDASGKRDDLDNSLYEYERDLNKDRIIDTLITKSNLKEKCKEYSSKITCYREYIKYKKFTEALCNKKKCGGMIDKLKGLVDKKINQLILINNYPDCFKDEKYNTQLLFLINLSIIKFIFNELLMENNNFFSILEQNYSKKSSFVKYNYDYYDIFYSPFINNIKNEYITTLNEVNEIIRNYINNLNNLIENYNSIYLGTKYIKKYGLLKENTNILNLEEMEKKSEKIASKLESQIELARKIKKQERQRSNILKNLI